MLQEDVLSLLGGREREEVLTDSVQQSWGIAGALDGAVSRVSEDWRLADFQSRPTVFSGRLSCQVSRDYLLNFGARIRRGVEKGNLKGKISMIH